MNNNSRIRELKSKINQLEKNNHRLKTIYNNAHDAIIIHDLAGNILDVNKNMCQIFGITRKEACSLKIKDISKSNLPLDSEKANWGKDLTGENIVFEWEFIKPEENTTFFGKVSLRQIKYFKNDAVLASIWNIASRKFENKLKRTRDLLKRTEGLSKVGGWEYDVKSEEMIWTDEVYNIYGVDKGNYDPNDINKTIEFYAPGDREIVREALFEAINNGKPNDLDLKFVNLRDETIWIRSIMRPVIENGEVIKVTGNLMDITDIKNTKKKLQKSKERYKAVFENTGIAIAIIEKDTTISMVNKNLEKLSGYSKKEIEGKKSWREFVVNDDVERIKNYHKNRREDPSKAPGTYKTRIIDKNGNIHIIIANTNMIPNSKKSITSFIEINEKIYIEGQFQYIWENANDGMRLTDQNGTITRVNRAYCELVRLKEEELVGKPMSVIYKKDSDHIIKKYSRRFEEDTIPEKIKGNFQLHNGQFRWFEIVNSVLDIPGNPKQVLGIFRDITKRKKMINRIRLTNEELASINNLALEINNTLDLNKVLNTALKEIISILDADGGIIYTSKGNEEKYLPRMHINISQLRIEEINYIS